MKVIVTPYWNVNNELVVLVTPETQVIVTPYWNVNTGDILIKNLGQG